MSKHLLLLLLPGVHECVGESEVPEVAVPPPAPRKCSRGRPRGHLQSGKTKWSHAGESSMEWGKMARSRRREKKNREEARTPEGLIRVAEGEPPLKMPVTHLLGTALLFHLLPAPAGIPKCSLNQYQASE
ncbi:uncharacterized protein LOC144576539 [Callithrix jacchus]